MRPCPAPGSGFLGSRRGNLVLGQLQGPEDGKFDILGPRKNQSGLLPVIIPFNEPAVGIGAAGGLYADNGTWAVAGGHMGIWNEGDIRYLGGLAYASVNIDFYGIGRDSDTNSNPIPYHIEGGGTVQQIQFRLWNTAFFAGTRYIFAGTNGTNGTNGTFDTDAELDDEGYSNNAGLSLFSSYGTRDNVFTPNAGTRAIASVARFSPRIGGDFTYGRMDLLWNQYLRLGGSLVFGLRMEYRNAGHGAPVYAMPWVRLRGIPVFRYFIARKLGLAMGLDVARGPEETVGYLTIGSTW